MRRLTLVRWTAGSILAVPGLWVFGLDQGAWLAAALLLGVAGIAGVRQRPMLTVLFIAFLSVAVISGVLGAQGTRWITLARELVIIIAFAATVLGVAHLGLRSRAGALLLAVMAFVMTVSASASLIAFFTQNEAAFETLIAPLIPSDVADTRLGAISFADRALGTTSYFLGQLFIRPQGLFLFSTSQAVAQTAAIPLFLAAASWFPAARWWFLTATALNAAALLATTTRVPIAGLAASFFAVWVARQWIIAKRQRDLTLKRAALPIAVLVAVGGLAVALTLSGTGAQVASTRSLAPRVELYRETVEHWLKQPILGWGTDVDWVPSSSAHESVGQVTRDALPPLGSHSQYLGVLFKQGLVGAAAFLAVIAVVGRHAISALSSYRSSESLLTVAFLATLVAGVTESLWLDPAAAVFTSVAWGGVLARRASPGQRRPPPDEGQPA